MTRNKDLYVYALVILSISMAALEVVLNFRNEIVPETTQQLWAFVFVVLSIIWAYNDADQNEIHKPFEFGFLAYALWPIVFPWYLVTTRGAEGMVLFLGFIAIWVGPWLAGLVAYAYSG